MAFAPRLLTRENAQCFIAIDIGSSTHVRSILFDAAARDRTALDTYSVELPEREQAADFIRLIDEHVRRIVFRYLRRAGRIPAGVIIGIGSHLTMNEIVTLGASRERPGAPLEQEELAAILERYVAAHRTRTAGDTAYTLASLVPFELAIEGYRVERLTRATVGQDIEIRAFAVYAQSAYGAALQRMRSLWGGMKVRFIPNRAATAAAVTSFLAAGDALVVNIGAKVTEVVLIGDGTILFTGEFKRGGEAASEAIARRLGIPAADAERMKRQFGTTTLPVRVAGSVRSALAESAEAWLKDLVELLRREERFLLPEKIYLLGGGARLAAVSEALAGAPWFRELTFSERISVEVLGAERFSALAFRNITPPLSGPEDTALASLVGHISGQIAVPEFFPAEVVERIE